MRIRSLILVATIGMCHMAAAQDSRPTRRRPRPPQPPVARLTLDDRSVDVLPDGKVLIDGVPLRNSGPLAANGPEANARLDETWTMTVGGQSVRVNPDGSYRIPNINAADDFGVGGPGTIPDFVSDTCFRATGVSSTNGVVRYVSSSQFQLTQGVTFLVDDLIISENPPALPETLVAGTASPVLTTPGETLALDVTVNLADGTSGPPLTDGACAATYSTTNPDIATIDSSGLVTAVDNGTVALTATQEGAVGVTLLTISLGDPLTTVVGFVLDDMGNPVPNATVDVVGQAASGMTDAAGRFEISGVATELGPVTVVASYTVGPQTFKAVGVGLTTVPAGFTDAGILSGSTDVFWINGAGGNWNGVANWGTGAIPGATDNPRIDLPGEYQVNVNINPTVNNLVFDAPDAELFASNRTFTTNDVDFDSGLITSVTSTWNGTGVVTNNTEFVARNSTNFNMEFNNDGSVRVVTTGGSGTLTVNDTLTNSNAISMTAENGFSANLTAAVFNNLAGATFDVGPGVGNQYFVTGEFNNDGTVNVDHDARFVTPFGETSTNNGTMNFLSGNSTFALSSSSTMNNGGTINLAEATLVINSGAVFNNLAGATFDIQFPPSFGPVSPPLTLSNTTFNYDGSILGGPEILMISSTMNLAPGADDPLTVTTNLGCNISGTIAAGQTFIVDGTTGIGTLTATTGLVNDGALVLTNSAGGSSARLNVSGGPIENNAGGTITAEAGTSGNRELTGELHNAGLITTFALTTFGSSFTHTNTNSGTMDLMGEARFNMTNTGSFDNSGALTMGAGDLLRIANGTFNHQAGATLTADEIDLVSFHTFNYDGVISGTPAIELNSSTFNIGAGANDPWVLTSVGASTISGVVAAGQTVVVDGTTGSGTLTAAGGLTNDGQITLTMSGGGFSTDLTLSGGPLINNGGGVILAEPGTGSNRDINGLLQNDGLMTINVLTRLGSGGFGATHLNSGTIDINDEFTVTQPSDATFSSGGIIDLASAGSMSVNGGDFVQTAAGTFIVGVDSPATHGQLTLFGSTDADLAGTLQLDFSAAPLIGDTYVIVTGGSITGSFDTVIANGLGAGQAVQVTVNAADVTVEVVAD